MPNFTNRPPENTNGPGMVLTRTPAGTPFIGVITSPDLIGCNTHWYGGRTQPCEAPDCQACQDGVPWAWHGYFSCLEIKTHRHVLYEVTAQAAQPLCAFRAQRGTLRCCKFEATRAGKRPNGRVFIRTKVFDDPTITIPDGPDLIRLLTIIWNVPKESAVPAKRQHNAEAIAIEQMLAAKRNAIGLTTQPHGTNGQH